MSEDLLKSLCDRLERRRAKRWLWRHDCPHRDAATIVLLPCGVGTVVLLRCPCGAEKDISNYDNW